MDNSFIPPSPLRNPETETFWNATREGTLLVKQCNACHEVFFYPRSLCPFCLSESSWIEASGKGTIYSHTRVHIRGGRYVLAMVTLAEGPTVMTNIQTVDLDAIQVGQAVHVAFVETTGEERLPIFVPDG